MSLLFLLAGSEVAVRRWGPVRFLFGMKPGRKRAGVAESQPGPIGRGPAQAAGG